MTTPNYREYLGDGVYAEWDGYHVVLKTEGNTICLDDTVQVALDRYRKRLRERVLAARTEGRDDG